MANLARWLPREQGSSASRGQRGKRGGGGGGREVVVRETWTKWVEVEEAGGSGMERRDLHVLI